jgi:hypothetical protein
MKINKFIFMTLIVFLFSLPVYAHDLNKIGIKGKKQRQINLLICI